MNRCPQKVKRSIHQYTICFTDNYFLTNEHLPNATQYVMQQLHQFHDVVSYM